MKKIIISIVIALALVVGIASIGISQEYTCKEPIMEKKVMQDLVNQWFIDKEAETFAFTEKQMAYVRNASVEAKDVADFLNLGIQETILYEHFTDEINCSIDRRKAAKLKRDRDIIHSTFGNRARTFFRRLPTVAKDEKGKQQLENFSGCYFNDIEPTLQKMYRKHPSRKSCAK